MNVHYLIYKHVIKETPYQKYIQVKQDQERKRERIQYYQDILKFHQSRYPEDLMNKLFKEINPFELSIDKLKEVYSSKFPQYANELVHQAVQFVFKRKSLQSQMVKQSSIIIQYGDEDIRNGRKLQKQNFSYMFDRISSQKKSADRSFSAKDIVTERDKQDSINSKIFQEIQAKADRFNKLLINAINDEKAKFQNIQVIQENDPKDSLFYKYSNSQRELANNSFPKFKDSDMVLRPDAGMETGRTEIEELNMLLGGLSRRDEEQMGQITGRSRASGYAVKINKEVMDNLYNARGKLKLDLVKRVVNKFKKQIAD